MIDYNDLDQKCTVCGKELGHHRVRDDACPTEISDFFGESTFHEINRFTNELGETKEVTE